MKSNILSGVFIVIVAMIGVSFFTLQYSKNIQKVLQRIENKQSGVNKNIQNNLAKNSSVVFKDAQNFTNKTKVLYYDEDGNVVLSDIDGTNVKTLIYRNGQFGSINQPELSPNGQYLVYLMLPPKITGDLNANPPYEFHGSSEYELILINVLTDETRVIKDKFSNGIGSDEIVWDKKSSGFYFGQPDLEDKNLNEQHFYYDVTSKVISKVDISPNKNSYISPDNEFFIKDQTLSATNTIDIDLSLSLYKSTGEYLKQVFNAQRYFEYDINFIASNYLLLASKSYGKERDLSNIQCFIDLINTETADTTNIETKPCYLPSNPTGIINPKLSPDNTKIVAMYVDKERKPESKFFSSFFIYDIENKTKEYTKKQDFEFDNYFFIKPNELLVSVFENPLDHTTIATYTLNLNTYEFKPYNALSNKKIIGVI